MTAKSLAFLFWQTREHLGDGEMVPSQHRRADDLYAATGSVQLGNSQYQVKRCETLKFGERLRNASFFMPVMPLEHLELSRGLEPNQNQKVMASN